MSDAVPFDRPDPAGAASAAPFADAADALRAIVQSVERAASAWLAKRDLALDTTASVVDGALAARWDATRARGALPPLLRAFDAWALDEPALGALAALVAGVVEEGAAAALDAIDARPLTAVAALVGASEAAIAESLAPFVDADGVATPWIVRLARGELVSDASLAGVVRDPAVESSRQCPFSDAALAALALVAERRTRAEPYAFVTAPPGYGLVDALAAELLGADTRVLVVDARAPALDRCHARRVAAEAALFGAAVVVHDADGRYLDAVAETGVPLFALEETIDAPTPSTSAVAVRIDVALPPRALRQQLWSDALGRRAPADELDAIAAIYAVGPATIRAAAAMALQAGEVTGATVGAALAPLAAGRLGPRARLLPTAHAEDLIVSDEVGDRLVAIVERARRRGATLHVSPSGPMTSPAGVTALLTGQPGAGKHTAARVIATALALPLYAVDVAPFAARWNAAAHQELATLLRAAASAPLVLLLENADAFTDAAAFTSLAALVAGSDGLVIVASNESAARAAAVELFTVAVHLPMPTERQRAALFGAFLPTDTALDTAALARRHVLSGGRIRALVVRAAELAAARGTPLDEAALAAAASAAAGK